MPPPLPHDYLVIEGNIGAGKTTLATRLAEQYACRLVLEAFADNPFLPLFYEDRDRYALTVELFFMAERHAQMGPLLSQPGLFDEPILADYVFVKTWLFARHTLKRHERELFRRLFDSLSQQVPLPRKLVYLHRPVDVLLANIDRRGRDYERHITAEYLGRVQRTYWDYFREEKRYPIVMLDLGRGDFEADPALMTRIRELIAADHAPGLTVERLDSQASLY